MFLQETSDFSALGARRAFHADFRVIFPSTLDLGGKGGHSEISPNCWGLPLGIRFELAEQGSVVQIHRGPAAVSGDNIGYEPLPL